MRVNAACREKLADFKVPCDVFVVAQTTRSILTKINKVELRKLTDPAADRENAVARSIGGASKKPSGEQA